MRPSHAPAPDQVQRDAAIAERARNVLVDAGAGTGKTTILVDRLVEMIAPTNDVPAIPIGRLAAITFTRKAAGELRLRIRERLLQELTDPALRGERAARLHNALSGLDVAYVGTIHSFADRLLRLRPVEAQLSPSYEIAEDDDALVRETFEVLLHAVESGTLSAELAGAEAAARADEATRTVLVALAAGTQAESRETEWQVLHGLDNLVAGFIRQRDIPPPDVESAPFNAPAFRAAADAFVGLAAPVSGASPGAVWIRRTATVLRRLRDRDEPVGILRELRQQLERSPRSDATKRDDFGGDDDAWQLWKVYRNGDRGRPGPLRQELTGPLHRWMATRLVRLFPVVVALYERVKARQRVLDQLDLLVKLRDLLVADRTIRAEFQQMFDHILVDEFQDTDPLQAEIVLFLCERDPRADRWEDVVLRDGALTLVGDPKQSIYRFRRADVAMYDRVRQIIARQDHLEARLSANFRSVPSLIEWLNDRFARVLGTSTDGRPFDPATGRVFQQPLSSGRPGSTGPAVQVISFDFADAARHKVDEYRALEGRALARYLRWLTETSDLRVTDPLDGSPRRVGYGDIAVLAVSTWKLSMLFPWLDAEGVPYASRGGTLFLADPLHCQFLLGLRALADRDDGVAEAAILRPPFFAVDLADLVLERAAFAEGRNPADEEGRRAREARELVHELRRRRFERAPGATARDLLDRTAFARAVALGPNGQQRLARLREICLVLEQIAAVEGLDYDAVSARLRDWVDSPIQLDPPHPVGSEAVQVLTVHQAKGLEFPVVVLWDGKGQWTARVDTGAWRMERDGRGWAMNLNGLSWEEPAGLNLKQTEQAFLDAERRRVAYVATTRARDLLIVPRAGTVPPGKYICGDLLDGADRRLVTELDPYRDGVGSAWATEASAPAPAARANATDVERQIAERWARASVEAARPRFRPVSVTGEARTATRDEVMDELEPASRKPRGGRFGSLFGQAVHHAIELMLRHEGLTTSQAVRRAAERVGLVEHLDDAVGDVARALEALRAERVTGPARPELRTEYPIAAAWKDGQLLGGFIDLVATVDDHLSVIDFKTDQPPAGSVEAAYPAYVSQVRTYGQLLEAAGVLAGRRLRCGLLFTADGVVRWVDA